ncbi:MAG: Gfo/Idh/MocA family oxidoreductase [Candidatus Omnitrophica bacterium]|nr:Gfo/Idh/MocA family oxidoreductase [Candidatus Omnitrophota bacterium]
MGNTKPRSTRIRVAQIGVGYWGPNLLRNLLENSRFEVCLVCDASAERRAFVKETHPDLRLAADAGEALRDPGIDAVVIATPAATHAGLVLEALKKGKHVFVEKPMATSSADIDAIGAAARASGLVAMAGHTFLYNEAVRFVKRLIDDGELGEVRYIYGQRLNLGRIRSDVDAMWNLAPHDVSILQYWLNDPAPLSVTKHGMSYVQPDVNDVVFLNLVYPDNVMANLHVSWLDPHRVRRMTVVGSRKMAVYDDAAKDKVVIYDKGIDPMAAVGEDMAFDKMNYEKVYKLRSGEAAIPKILFREPLKTQMDHFADCILKKTPCLTGPEHARKVVRILEMADASVFEPAPGAR